MAVYQLVRHGIAHNFAAKAPLEITKAPAGTSAADHLRRVASSGVTRIDANQLFVDLRTTYLGRFKPVANGSTPGPLGESAGSMQTRLDDLLSRNADALKKRHELVSAADHHSVSGGASRRLCSNRIAQSNHDGRR